MKVSTFTPNRQSVVRLGCAVIILAMVSIVVQTLRSQILQFYRIDPFIYTGIIHDYQQILRRYGVTYYANRVGFTVPARIAIDLFGDRIGHVVTKYCYLTAIAVSSFVIGSRFYSRAIGLTAAAWAVFNPWIVRALDWDYVDGVAITYALVGICCLLTPRHKNALGHIVGGAFFAFACNSNTFTAVLAVTLIPTWVLLHSSKGLLSCVKLATFAALGFVIGYVVIVLVQYIELPELGFGREIRTFVVALQLLGMPQSPWFHPLSDLLKHKVYYVFMPAVLITISVFTFLKKEFQSSTSRFAVSALCFVTTTYGFFLLCHYALHTIYLTYSFYFSYLFPPTLLMVVAFLGENFARLSKRSAVLCCCASILCFGLTWVCFDQLSTFVVGRSAAALIITVLVIGLALLLVRMPLLRTACAIIICTLAISIFYNGTAESGSGSASQFEKSEKYDAEGTDYVLLHSRTEAKLEQDAYEGAVFLQQAVAKTFPLSAGPVGFWYGARPDGALFSCVQSVFLWGFSNVISPALPEKVEDRIDAETRRKLAQYRHLVVLSRGEQEAEMAVHALAADGSTTRIRATFVYPGKLLGYRATFVDVLPAPAPVGAEVARLPDSALSAQNDGNLTTEADGVRLLTDRRQWAYSASASLAALNLPARPLVLRVNATVVKGRISIMVLDKASNSTVIGETTSAQVDEGQVIDVRIPDGSRASDVVLRNVVTGTSIVTVTGLTIYDSASASPN